jgi:hypothetical protein
MNNPQPIYVKGEPIVITKNISYITINIIELKFNTSATLLVQFFENNSMPIKNEILELSQFEYNLWGSNDQYIIDLVCSRYNLSLSSPGRI